MRVLVTGSAGFLGSHFTRSLTDEGHHVTEIDVLATDPVDARDFFRRSADRFDLVLHCAAVVGGRRTIDYAPMEQAVDLELDAGLFRWALGDYVGRVVYFSSSAAYPVARQRTPWLLAECDADPFDPLLPDALYGWTKLTGERLAHHAREAGLPVTVVRPFSGYGTDQAPTYPFPAICRRAIERHDPIVVWGDGNQVRDFIHVDDLVAATLALAKAGVDGPVNIGTGRPTSMFDLATLAAEAVGYRPRIEARPDEPQGVAYRVADCSLFQTYYTPQVSLEEGIARFVEAECG